MARDENPPFERGHTWYDGATPDANDLGGENILGQEWVFEDVNPTTGVARTNRPVKVRAVRNTSGAALLPKHMVVFSTTAGEFGKNVDGYATTTSQDSFPVDEYLPTAGVADDDIFYIVMEGPAVIKNSTTTIAGNILSVGNWVAAVTFNQTTGNSTCGRIGLVASSTAATTPLFNVAAQRVGRALSAVATSGVTDQDVLVDCGKW